MSVEELAAEILALANSNTRLLQTIGEKKVKRVLRYVLKIDDANRHFTLKTIDDEIKSTAILEQWEFKDSSKFLLMANVKANFQPVKLKDLASLNDVMAKHFQTLNLPSNMSYSAELPSEFKKLSKNLEIIHEALVTVEKLLADEPASKLSDLQTNIDQANSYLGKAWAIIDLSNKDLPKPKHSSILKILNDEQKIL